MKKFNLTLIVVLALTTIISGQGVYLYQHPNYAGDSRFFNTNIPNLDADNINFADVASSINIDNLPAGVELYDGANYTGAMFYIQADISDLTPWGWNDRIGSLKIPSTPPQGVYLYEHPNYQGDLRFFPTNVPDLDLGTINFADVASSLTLFNIGGVSLYDFSNFGGETYFTSNDIPNLGTYGWNDRVGSLKISSVGIDDLSGPLYSISASPNPAKTSIILKVLPLNTYDLYYSIYDIKGKILLIGQILNQDTEISLDQLLPASYYLKITKDQKTVKILTIVKQP